VVVGSELELCSVAVWPAVLNDREKRLPIKWAATIPVYTHLCLLIESAVALKARLVAINAAIVWLSMARTYVRVSRTIILGGQTGVIARISAAASKHVQLSRCKEG
jgi:hypothetical protein